MDYYHLSSNLLGLYAISRIEYRIGLKKFILLIVFLLIFNSIIEMALYKTVPTTKCSVGFSGVLFGIYDGNI